MTSQSRLHGASNVSELKEERGDKEDEIEEEVSYSQLLSHLPGVAGD